MTPAVEQLVRETIELTGAQQPAMFDDDAPVLSADTIQSSDEPEEGGFYLVGLIGGKEVGKSALVNALAGQRITEITSHGPGTEIAVAYAHASQADPLRKLLESEVPGKFRIIPHNVAALRRQVLVDLPDIDSHYESHLAVTRAMLRHMLFPVWVQSVEKYADMQPHQMLMRVSAGNAAENFIFCLNKVDQLRDSAGKPQVPPANGAADANGYSPAVLEVRDDYASRLQRSLKLAKPPRVFLVSALSPGQNDLPVLRQIVCKEKTKQEVRESRVLAGRQQDRSLASWLASLDLKGRAEHLSRLRADADDLIGTRVTSPLMEQVLPKLADDPATRQALSDEVLTDRLARWPMLGLVHVLMSPLFMLFRTMYAKNVAPLQGPEALADFYLRDETPGGWSAARAVQSAFAMLRQAQPAVGALYETDKLWEDLPAQQAADELRKRLAKTIKRQREALRQRIRGGSGFLMTPVRWLLTIGALLWFPLVQPVLQGLLSVADLSLRAVFRDFITALGADYLAKTLGFLAAYFLVLWLALRWNTQRNVTRLSARWLNNSDADPELSLTAQALQWVDDLTEPVRKAHERMESLCKRLEKLDTAAKK